MLTCRAFAYESRVKRSSLPIPTILSSVKMDDDQADVLKSVVCLLTVASVAKAKAKARAKKVRRKRKTVWVRQWLLDRPNYGLYDQLMAQLAEGDVKSFINFMRMEPEMFYKLVEDLTPKIKKKTTRWREPLPPALRLAVTLRYLATGESYQSLGYAFRVAPNTLVSMVPEVCQAIYDHYHDMVFKCPTTEEEWKEVAQAFSNKWHFHHCCGCIDGKHVRIQAPAHSGSLYHNYKGFSSVIMLAVVDANYRFLYVDMGSYGADSDAGIFRETGLYQALEEDKASLPGSEPLPDGDAAVPYFLVGDDAFPLRSWLMKPHSKKELSPEERIFNYRLCRARRIVENAFGILANRCVSTNQLTDVMIS
ncbi:protein ALP1-like [Branchiostoma floridae]|uniref:Protein ALP1-like n=1 Tax=Branchiostoma floridae TaxID=7739 RepID=A0A9J7KG17_BRAFL|nr:protein ALP1-like [Branchiostoma floridae]